MAARLSPDSVKKEDTAQIIPLCSDTESSSIAELFRRSIFLRV